MRRKQGDDKNTFAKCVIHFSLATLITPLLQMLTFARPRSHDFVISKMANGRGLIVLMNVFVWLAPGLCNHDIYVIFSVFGCMQVCFWQWI